MPLEFIRSEWMLDSKRIFVEMWHHLGYYNHIWCFLDCRNNNFLCFADALVFNKICIGVKRTKFLTITDQTYWYISIIFFLLAIFSLSWINFWTVLFRIFEFGLIIFLMSLHFLNALYIKYPYFNWILGFFDRVMQIAIL